MEKLVSFGLDPVYGVGMLGATCTHPEQITSARLDMIERRILRMEMAMRRAGNDPENLPLPS